VSQFSVVIFTSEEPQRLKQLLRHLVASLLQIKLGVLYENARVARPNKARARRDLKSITSPAAVRSAIHGLAMCVQTAGIRLFDRVLRRLHCAPGRPNGAMASLGELIEYAERNAIEFCLTDDSFSQAASDFVRRMTPDLGVVYGAPTRNTELHGIPKNGSIALEVRDRSDESGDERPAVHDVKGSHVRRIISVRLGVADFNVGEVLGERTLLIEEYDTPASIGVKSNLLGVECLVDVIRRKSLACFDEQGRTWTASGIQESHNGLVPQSKAVAPRNGRRFRPKYGRPLIKLLARFLLYPWVFLLNRKRATNQTFPIVILFGHVVADRPKFMGISTDQFLRQVKFLKKHYKIASLAEAMEMIRERKVIVPTVVLTFDDGYEDNHLGMRAVIDSEEIPVTLFVCTRNVEEHRPFDHDLKRSESDFFPLTWNQLRDFERQGSTIGSHTRTHFDCGATDESVLVDQIIGSYEDLRRNLGHDVPYFSFPWGYPKNMSAAALTIASDTYPYLFSAYGGSNNVRKQAPALFKRISWPDSLLELELSLQGLLDFRRDEMPCPLDASRNGDVGTEASSPLVRPSEAIG
jgi:peptidoglycan/xylan/chitin deacetylase (PgdA/CDA1 family)